MELLTRIWGAAEALAGSLSVGFILLIGLVLVVFAGVYLVAAFVVLARFARSAGSLRVIATSALLICPLYAALWLQVTQPELAIRGEWSSSFTWLTVFLYGICAVTLPLGRMALRRGGRGILLGVVVAGGLGVFMSVVLGRFSEASILSSVLYGWAGLVVLVLLPLSAAGLFEIRRGAEWFIATRYLVAERRQVFISAITLICVGAVAAGVWLIITVLSVMNGFERTWRDEIVGNYAHFLVRSYYGEVVDYGPLLGEIERVDGVLAVTPYIEAEGMIRGVGGVIAPVSLRGIDPQRAPSVTRFAEKVTAGRIDDLMPDPEA